MAEAFYILLAAFLYREWQHGKEVKALVDRLMSRSYYDFKVSEKASAGTIKDNSAKVDDFEEPGTLNGMHPFA